MSSEPRTTYRHGIRIEHVHCVGRLLTTQAYGVTVGDTAIWVHLKTGTLLSDAQMLAQALEAELDRVFDAALDAVHAKAREIASTPEQPGYIHACTAAAINEVRQEAAALRASFSEDSPFAAGQGSADSPKSQERT